MRLEIGKYYRLPYSDGDYIFYIKRIEGTRVMASYLRNNSYYEDSHMINVNDNYYNICVDAVSQEVEHLNQCISARIWVEYKSPEVVNNYSLY